MFMLSIRAEDPGIFYQQSIVMSDPVFLFKSSASAIFLAYLDPWFLKAGTDSGSFEDSWLRKPHYNTSYNPDI